MKSLVRELLELSYEQACRERAEALASALGTYHVGGGGVLVDGLAYGGCPRRALLRSLGIDSTLDSASELMTSGGRANELYWQRRLGSIPGSPYLVLPEGSISVTWHTKAGTKVTGHPDGFIAIADEASPVVVEEGEHLGKHVRILKFIELKRVSTIWKSKEYIFSGTPGDDHLMQSAHYSWKLGELQGSPVPIELCYTQDVKFFCPDWGFIQGVVKKLPHLLKLNNRGLAQDLLPSIAIYLGEWQDGTLVWTRESEPDTLVKSAITVAGIEEYYASLDTMVATKTLCARPADKVLSTGAKKGWSSCDPKYCEFAESCDACESDFDTWVAACRGCKKMAIE